MTQKEQEIDIISLLQRLKRFLPWIILLSLALAAAAYFQAKAQPKVYEAHAALLVTGGSVQPSDAVLGNALVKAPPLPQGAIEEALHSISVMNPLIQTIKSEPKFTQAEKARLSAELSDELTTQKFRVLQLTARVDQYSGGNGIYTITARANSPKAASVLANLAASALLEWDEERALRNVRQAQQGFEAQLSELESKLSSSELGEDEREALLNRRATLLESLTQVSILEQSTSGVLSQLSPAVPPRSPVEPSPVRNAVLLGLLGLLLGLGAALIRLLTDRRVRSEADLLELDLPILATLNQVNRRDVLLHGILGMGRQAGLYEALGFLRVNLMGALKQQAHPTVMITSSAPGEGKSSVTATLADNIATSGQRVLIVDADFRRGTQADMWRKVEGGNTLNVVQLTGQGGFTNTREAIRDPYNVGVVRVSEHIDLLPAGRGTHDTLSYLTDGQLTRALEVWKPYYDWVLIDSPPLLALADGLLIGEAADAVLLVVEYGSTDLRALRQALGRAKRNGLNTIGCVINKAAARDEDGYNYSYSYDMKG